VEKKDAWRRHLGTRIKEHGADGPILDIVRMSRPGTWLLAVTHAQKGRGCHASKGVRQGKACQDSQWPADPPRHSKRSPASRDMDLATSATAAMRPTTQTTMSSSLPVTEHTVRDVKTTKAKRMLLDPSKARHTSRCLRKHPAP
jgi:hypothetical protein